MSNKALTWCWDAAEAGLIDSSGAVHVLAVLADHGTDHAGEDWTCFPSVKRIMARTRLSQSAVERHLKWLVAERWISRAPLPNRKRDDEDKGLFLYTLHRGRALEPVGDLPTGEADDLSAICERPVGNLEPTCRQFDGSPTPPNKDYPSGNPQGTNSLSGARALEEAGSPDFEGLPGDRARRAQADRTEAAYRRLAEAWLKRQPGRVRDDRARMAFSAAIAEGEDADTIASGGMLFLAESPDAKPPRLPHLDGWIKGKLWRGFEPKEGSASEAADAGAPRFDGPAEVVGRVIAVKGRDWFVSWIARCGWDEANRAIVARGDFSADRIRRELRGLLGELKICVIVRKAEAA